MSCGSLRNFIVRTWLDGMDEVWKLDSILNEEDRNVVAHDIYDQRLVKASITSARILDNILPKFPSSV